jgi:hypothetical protein
MHLCKTKGVCATEWQEVTTVVISVTIGSLDWGLALPHEPRPVDQGTRRVANRSTILINLQRPWIMKDVKLYSAIWCWLPVNRPVWYLAVWLKGIGPPSRLDHRFCRTAAGRCCRDDGKQSHWACEANLWFSAAASNYIQWNLYKAELE